MDATYTKASTQQSRAKERHTHQEHGQLHLGDVATRNDSPSYKGVTPEYTVHGCYVQAISKPVVWKNLRTLVMLITLFPGRLQCQSQVRTGGVLTDKEIGDISCNYIRYNKCRIGNNDDHTRVLKVEIENVLEIRWQPSEQCIETLQRTI